MRIMTPGHGSRFLGQTRVSSICLIALKMMSLHALVEHRTVDSGPIYAEAAVAVRLNVKGSVKPPRATPRSLSVKEKQERVSLEQVRRKLIFLLASVELDHPDLIHVT